MFNFEDVKIKEEMPDEYSLPSQLLDNMNHISSYTPDTIQSATITQSEKPKISVKKNLSEKSRSYNQNERTIKRSQSATQKEDENPPRYYHDRERNSHSYSGNSYDDSNAAKKPRLENQTQNRNNRQEYSSARSNENIRKDNNQNPSTSRNTSFPVRTNDPRLNRVADNESSSTINTYPTQAVPLPPITPRIQYNMDAILQRCTKALDLILNLKDCEQIPMVLFKYSELKPQQQSSERAKKSPLILNPKNVKYMLQASEDSSTECQIALLSRQFRNISFPLQRTIRVLGADIGKISFGVANAELKRQKEESPNESMRIIYLSDKRFRIIGTQTEDVTFVDKETIPKTFATIGINCNGLVIKADKSQQTNVNTDGFHFSIDSLLLMTPAQRQGLQAFKKVSCFR